MKTEVFKRALEREKKRRAQAERLLEEKSRKLFLSYESLQQSNEDLAKALEEVNNKQHQLVQSAKMASLGVMSAGIAHEINNPLAFVFSNINALNEAVGAFSQYYEHVKPLLVAESERERTTLLKALESFVEESALEELLEDSSDLIAETTEGVARVKAIVSGLQSFARSDSGVFERVDIHECIKTTVRLAKNQIKQNTDVNFDFGDLPEIMGYPNKLGQVFLNLLVNASHAMVEAPGHKLKVVNIKTRHQGSAVTIAVTDNGCGMDQATIDSVFTPFFTTKEVGDGTGLGLAISHGIIEEHQGTIEVESSLGVGTTFTLTLPITQIESRAA